MTAKKDRPKYYSTILRLEEHLYHNAHNLLADACILYRERSFPTAFALAVLAYEELGKLHMVDHIGHEAWVFPRQREDQLDRLFSRDLGYNHVIKQRWALAETQHRPFSHKYHDGHLDRLKQGCFYVGFRRGRIMSPDRISARTAYNQIKRVVKLSKQTGDLAFLNMDCQSTRETRALAKRYNDCADDSLQLLRRPRARERVA